MNLFHQESFALLQILARMDGIPFCTPVAWCLFARCRQNILAMDCHNLWKTH